ncbi:cadherin-like beta sandwich domain-containing protein [bacterium]|nr:cadherin-like beta sandwich domain-containing protein [bacterium]
MTKKKKIIFLLLSLFFFCGIDNVFAATISVAGTTSQGVVGGGVTVNVTVNEPSGLGAWEFNLSYDSSILTLNSGQTHVVDYVQSPGQTRKTYSYKFTVKKEGNANIGIASSNFVSYDEQTRSAPKDSTTINCIKRETIIKNYSSNNNLKSLGVKDHQISPEFNKNELNYTLEVENDVKKITIEGSKEDNKSSITGLGEKEVHEGANPFDIVVTAENGTTKTYHLTVNVKELDPINVKVDKKGMTVIQKEEELDDKVPNHFEKTTVKINDKDVLAYENKVLKLTIVALKDDKGNITFYEYKDNNYKLYKQLTSGNISIHILDDTKKIPKGYSSYKSKIDNVEYLVYKINKEDSFFLIYGENIETGKKSLYNYDEVEKTIQRYNKVETKSNNNQKYLILGLLGLVLLLLLILLILLGSNKRNKKNKKIRKRIEEKYDGKEKF